MGHARNLPVAKFVLPLAGVIVAAAMCSCGGDSRPGAPPSPGPTRTTAPAITAIHEGAANTPTPETPQAKATPTPDATGVAILTENFTIVNAQLSAQCNGQPNQLLPCWLIELTIDSKYPTNTDLVVQAVIRLGDGADYEYQSSPFPVRPGLITNYVIDAGPRESRGQTIATTPIDPQLVANAKLIRVRLASIRGAGPWVSP